MRYRTIVADPPWHYDGYASMPGNPARPMRPVLSKAMPYESLTVAQIAALPVPPMCLPDAVLFMWTTNRYLPDVFAVIDGWGFQYRQTLVWHKTGNPTPFGGTVAPNHAEFLTVSVQGKHRFLGRLPSSVISVPKPYQHSRKPEAFLDLVESLSPGPYLELFARRQRLGWDTWGDEALPHITLPTDELGLEDTA